MLTAPLRETLAEVELYLAEHEGRSPAVRDICDALGLTSPARVHANLIELERRGFISRQVVGGPKPAIVRVVRSLRVPIPIYDADTNQIRGYLPNV